MRYRKLIVYFFTALLLAVAVCFGSYESKWQGGVTLTVVVTSDDREEEICSWENDVGQYYLFFPSYASLSGIRIYTNVTNTVRLNGEILTDGMSCEGLELDTPYELTYEQKGELYAFTITFLKSAEVPTMYLDVASGSMDQIHSSIDKEEPGTVRLYTADGILDYSGNVESVKGRGNSTWEVAKKPYNLTLYQESDLLGMGKAAKWILLANGYDPSNLRNKMVYDFAKTVGMDYTPECRWVDLYLNGEYAGPYLLTEKNEVHSQRVDLNGEGSFLVSKNWQWRMEEKGQPYITTDSLAALRIHYSDISEDALTSLWQSVENAILAEDGMDPVTGKHWTELIDVDSWAVKMLIEEIFANMDAGTLSQFFYREGTSKIFAGPVWDYDLTVAKTLEPNMFFANRAYVYGSPWYSALYQKEEFYARLTELYETLCRPALVSLLDSGIGEYAAAVYQPSKLNRVRWGGTNPEEETAYIREFLSERMAFLDSVWLEGEEYLTVYVLGNDGAVTCYGLRPGETIPGLDAYGSTETAGWYDDATDQPFDITQPIWEDTVIYLKHIAGG